MTTHNKNKIIAAGAASRDAEIAELREANSIACEDIVVQQNLRVTYAEQIAELVSALKFAIAIIGHPDDGGTAYLNSVLAKWSKS